VGGGSEKESAQSSNCAQSKMLVGVSTNPCSLFTIDQEMEAEEEEGESEGLGDGRENTE
jgi:hypothetical protein